MKRTLIAIVAAMLAVTSVVSLAGCGGNNDKKESTAEASAQENNNGALADADTTATIKDVKVELNGDGATAIQALGTDYTYSAQTSCHANSGEDKTYAYQGFTVNTYPNDGKESVLEVIVTSGDYATSKGVKVGDKLAAVTAAYGDKYRTIGQKFYVYENEDGKKQIRFSIENDTVTQIDYYYNV